MPTQTPRVYLALFADDACTYSTDRKEGYVLRKMQRGLTSMKPWCQPWNIPFANQVKYLGIIIDRKITRTLHIETIEAMASTTSTRVY
jgi:hypothetical protein